MSGPGNLTPGEAWEIIKQAGGVVTAAEIANRRQVSRAYVAQITKREDFPAPVTHVGKQAVWLWSVVEVWLQAERRPGPKSGR